MASAQRASGDSMARCSTIRWPFFSLSGRRTYALIVISNCSTQNTAPNGEREGAIRRQLNGSPACAAVTQRYDWMQPVRDAESRRWEKRTLAQVGC